MDKKEILDSMSLIDKAKLFVGKNFWELEAINGKNIVLSDGPHGIRKEVFDKKKRPHTVKAVCYPAACLSACSFNKELFYRFGQELGKECIRNNIDVLLGPGINIKRNPLCGRNFEYFSEDPYLSGKLASNYINGVQSKHVGVSLKHFALNSQEMARFISNSVASERTMREIYLKAFEIAVKESHPWTIMASYNLINGVHNTENKWLLTDVARKEWGFDGIFVSDWGAVCHPVESLKAGLDLEMPGISKGSEYLIKEAIDRRQIEESVLEESTSRLVDLYLKTSQEKVDDFDLDHALKVAKEINDESIVLLKNDNHILPLNLDLRIGLIGDFAKHPRFQGGGSSQINALNVTNLYDELTKEGVKFKYAQGYVSEDIKGNKKLIKQAVDMASQVDTVLIMCGLPRILESEGYDRDNMDLPSNQIELINEVCKVNKNVIIILQNGSPVTMPFYHNVKGILETYLGGSMHATSIKDILIGKVNPSGRLAESFPYVYEDCISSKEYLSDPYTSLYKDSIYIGYRYYESVNKKVLFPFGFGLSYSSVVYSNLRIKDDKDKLIITFTIDNHSDVPCKDVPQIYIGQLNPVIFKAKKELRAFEKISLDAYEKKDIKIEVLIDDLRHFSNKYHRWSLEGGTYRVYLAHDSHDESNYLDINIKSDDEKEDFSKLIPVYYKLDYIMSDEDFEFVIGKNVIKKRNIKPYTLESPIIDLKKHPLGWVVFNIARIFVTMGLDKYDKKMYVRSIPYQPIRSIQMLTPKPKSFIDGVVDVFNNHPIQGIKKMKDKTKVL